MWSMLSRDKDVPSTVSVVKRPTLSWTNSLKPALFRATTLQKILPFFSLFIILLHFYKLDYTVNNVE